MSARKVPSERGARHVWLDAVVAAEGIDAFTIATAAVLYIHMNNDGVCWPSTRLMADEAHCSRNTVEDRIRQLQRLGLLEVERRLRGKNTYRALVPSGSWGEPDTRRRSGSPERSSGSPHEPSGSPERSSGSYQRSSGSPGAPEPLTDEVGEPVNRGALSGGAPDGSPALAPAQLAHAAKVMAEIDRRIEEYDAELDYWLDQLDPEKLLDPPDTVWAAEALVKRINALGGVDRDREGEYVVRPDITARQASELEQIELWLRIWHISPTTESPPGWLARVVTKRAEYLDNLRTHRGAA